MNNKSLIKKLVEAFDFGKLKPKNQTVNQATMQLSLLRMNEYNQELLKAVDLGLPSGTLWCKFNVGAENESETEYGEYFAWGETEPKKKYSWTTYIFDANAANILSKYNEEDKLTLLLPEDDVATVNMGKYWCMPTVQQLQELVDNTTNKWIKNYKDSGVNGRLFTSKTNGNTLFFPAAGGYNFGSLNNDHGGYGYIWSSTLDPLAHYDACSMYFTSIDINLYSLSRVRGKSVRAVFNG